MLSALDENGKLVSLLDEIPKRQDFCCPACHSPVRLKNGTVMRVHFAHVSLENCDFYSENESGEHLGLKSELYRSISRTDEVVIEKILPELGQAADLFVNDKLALEVQCSRLSEKRLRQRTISYQNAGYSVLWLLGEKLWLRHHLTPLHRQFLYFSQNMGFHMWELDLKKSEIRLNYLIYEDLHGRVHYLTKSCAFSADVMAFLRLPYQRQTLSAYQVTQDSKITSYIQKQLIARNSRWLKRQEEAYLKGKNLLTQSLSEFYPQVKPPEFKEGFCQIKQDLTAFYKTFEDYYQNQGQKRIQTLYPPAYYGRMVNNAQKRRK
ncbi:competence protein CoiA [Streptococcus equinus]|uniref:competence protein CoiA n=1 Tax=Streptococcus equinus TaxID=1335 RepID=UPI000F6BA8CF|nr:competence protein CoiA family protein [Streptococcus equinus]VEE21754.1 competence protein CoiA [Streptococcus equinus]